jgi:hypothetical protein
MVGECTRPPGRITVQPALALDAGEKDGREANGLSWCSRRSISSWGNGLEK